ncbi:hypothetical protein [Mycobacterium noviomagense]|uniref:hypothetical protein n=1 Tax=Mycobacterium noviomagense TaxID=459858 RepID=UPI0013D7F116|nr:hypothetical protein [Mycobacterium noviomagense]
MTGTPATGRIAITQGPDPMARAVTTMEAASAAPAARVTTVLVAVKPAADTTAAAVAADISAAEFAQPFLTPKAV